MHRNRLKIAILTRGFVATRYWLASPNAGNYVPMSSSPMMAIVRLRRPQSAPQSPMSRRDPGVAAFPPDATPAWRPFPLIKIFHDDHNPPHFHVEYAVRRAGRQTARTGDPARSAFWSLLHRVGRARVAKRLRAVSGRHPRVDHRAARAPRCIACGPSSDLVVRSRRSELHGSASRMQLTIAKNSSCCPRLPRFPASRIRDVRRRFIDSRLASMPVT